VSCTRVLWKGHDPSNGSPKIVVLKFVYNKLWSEKLTCVQLDSLLFVIPLCKVLLLWHLSVFVIVILDSNLNFKCRGKFNRLSALY